MLMVIYTKKIPQLAKQVLIQPRQYYCLLGEILVPPWNQITYLILSNENIMQSKLWFHLEIRIIYFYSIIFIAIAARNVYEGITNSDRNLSVDMTINYNQNVTLLHTLSMPLSSLFSLLLPCPLFSFISQCKKDIQKHDYTKTDQMSI